ncbi:hypothetical protein [Sphingomonas sp. ACRSK]|uniref:hypothetical protein n=1 Tax=Sphingomonas sp. ACRSK TaxID=2918213 RepID=UPI001EF718C0|nr:hypothetical protein [Sphingomonas sp. ACRSK]MCG7348828.1 hypothetical protein [Sphingomonas sp. ACRSK]
MTSNDYTNAPQPSAQEQWEAARDTSSIPKPTVTVRELKACLNSFPDTAIVLRAKGDLETGHAALCLDVAMDHLEARQKD